MKVMSGCVVWIVMVGLGLVIVSLMGCAQPVTPDPWAPWTNIPRPIKCGPRCEQWEEPGMMVQKREWE